MTRYASLSVVKFHSLLDRILVHFLGMSKIEVPLSLRPRWEPSSAKTADVVKTALEIADRQFMIVGFNAVVRSLSNLACVVVFCDAGSLIASLPIDAYMKGIPVAALSAPSKDLLDNLKLRKVACIGLKREALVDERIANAVLAVRVDCNITVPYGDVAASLAGIKPQAVVPAAKTKVVKQPSVAAPKPKPNIPVKRFFSNLD